MTPSDLLIFVFTSVVGLLPETQHFLHWRAASANGVEFKNADVKSLNLMVAQGAAACRPGHSEAPLTRWGQGSAHRGVRGQQVGSVTQSVAVYLCNLALSCGVRQRWS